MDARFSQKMQHAVISWKIHNFFNGPLEENHSTESPEFVANLGTPTKWSLIITGRHKKGEDHITTVSLKRSPYCLGPKLLHVKVRITLSYPCGQICWQNEHSTGFYVTSTVSFLDGWKFSDIMNNSRPLQKNVGTLMIFCDLILNDYVYMKQSDTDADLKTLSEDLKIFYKTRNFCDLDLIVAKSNKTLSVHRAIAKARSPYFALKLHEQPQLHQFYLPDDCLIESQIENLISYWYSGDLSPVINTFSPNMWGSLMRMQESDLIPYVSPEMVRVSTRFDAVSLDIAWSIENFSVHENTYCLQSPIFYHYINEEIAWRLDFYPKGTLNDTGYMSFCIKHIQGNVNCHSIFIELYLKGEEDKYCISRTTVSCMKEFEEYGFHRFMDCKMFDEHKNVLLKSDTLRIGCRMKYGTGKVINEILSTQRVCISTLDEKNSYLTLVNDMKKLYVSGDMSDICLRTSGKIFKAHIPILAARSRHFDSIFRKSFYDKSNLITINVENIEPEGLDKVLKYIYYAKPIELNLTTALQLYSFVKIYKISRLENTISNYIELNLTLENVLDVFKMAHNFKDFSLENAAGVYIDRNWKILSKTKIWHNFQHDNKELSSQFVQS